MKRSAGLLVCATLFLPLLAGCRLTPYTAPPLPAVEWDTLEDARQILIDRQDAIESVQAQLKLKITTPAPDAQTNTLDAALVIRGNDHFRMRAWKLNQAVFDLTATPEGTFIVASKEMKKNAPEAEQDLAKLTDQLGALLRGPDYSAARIASLVQTDRNMVPLDTDHTSGVHELLLDWDYLYSQIDAKTLVPSYFAVRPTEKNSQIVVKPVYMAYDGLIWYRNATISGDFGTVEMTFRDVELNGELNPRAFKPSRRAVRIDGADAGPSETASP